MLEQLVLLTVLAGQANMADSVFRVESVKELHDFKVPWRTAEQSRSAGTAFLIAQGRVLTNAHVVAGATQLTLTRFDKARTVAAQVEAVCTECDLALLKVSDDSFFKGLKAFELGEVPSQGSHLVQYGFSAPAPRVSVSEGVLNRLVWNEVAFTRSDARLMLESDVTANPGSSGGPVTHQGRLVGVHAQGNATKKGMAQHIPVSAVRHFLRDLEDGRYDGYPSLPLSFQPLRSDVLRRERGVPAGVSGVVISRVVAGGTTDGFTLPGDVLVAIDGRTVDAEGYVDLGHQKIPMFHLFDEKQVGEPVALSLIRDGKRVEVKAPSRRLARVDAKREKSLSPPRFLVYAGLVFQPLERRLIDTFVSKKSPKLPAEFLWQHALREWELPEQADREVVVLTQVLRHSIHASFAWSGPVVIERVNGRDIDGLASLSAALTEGKGEFQAFEFWPHHALDVLPRQKADAAHAEILSTYGVGHAQNI